MNYLIVLFKNKEKQKIINKFKTKRKALDYFQRLSDESTKVVFEKRTENGNKCHYELSLLENKEFAQEKVYIKDELGRTIKVETDAEDYSIIKVINYRIEEEFLDYSTKNKITYPVFEKTYLNKSGVKMLSKLNNKIVYQFDDILKLFTFKDIDDADRFIDSVEIRMRELNKMDCIIVKDYSFPQRKYLYNLLVDKGFPKSYLQRYSTAHPSKK